ncbi:AAA family ATPase, partial [Paenibacillus sp. TAF58]
ELRAYQKEEWFKKLVDLMILKKGILSDKDREIISGLILGEGEIENIENEEVIENNEENGSQSNISLMELSEISNVGALNINSEVHFSPNLTVFYGKNGAGKSSYFKAISVFSKRPYKIKGYINEHKNNDSSEKTISVSYTQRNEHIKKYYEPDFQVNTITQRWSSIDDSFVSELKEFVEVFNNENIDIVIEKGRNLNWKLEPFKLHYFDLLIKELENIQAFFDKEIHQNNINKEYIERTLASIFSKPFLEEFISGPSLILNSEIFKPLDTEESNR